MINTDVIDSLRNGVIVWNDDLKKALNYTYSKKDMEKDSINKDFNEKFVKASAEK